MTAQSARIGVAGMHARPRSRWRRRTIPWVFAGPAAALFALFFAYPLAASLLQSLEGGVGNYTRLAGDPSFLQSLVNVALILVVQVPIMIGLATVLAYVLNHRF